LLNTTGMSLLKTVLEFNLWPLFIDNGQGFDIFHDGTLY